MERLLLHVFTWQQIDNDSSTCLVYKISHIKHGTIPYFI